MGGGRGVKVGLCGLGIAWGKSVDVGEGNCGDKLVEVMAEFIGFGDRCLSDVTGVCKTEKCCGDRAGLEGVGDGAE